MALTKFIYPPESSSYAVKDGVDVVSVQLQGGAGRYRKDVLGSSSTVDCSWIFDTYRYKYFRAFYRSVTEKGATPFSIDLLLDEPTLTEHKAYFIPGSVSLNQTSGGVFFVSCQLEVTPIAADEAADIEYVTLLNSIHPVNPSQFPYLEDIVNTIINTNLPEYL